MIISKAGRKKQKTTKLLFREFSAGGVVFKKKADKISWLITSSSPSPEFPKSFWRLPKGWIDDGKNDSPGPLTLGKTRATTEELQKAALREVREEGGVEAKIVVKIDTEKYFLVVKGRRIFKIVIYFLMEWVKDIPGGPGFETAEAVFLPYEEARKKLSFSSSKKILDKAKEILDKGIQGNLI